MNVLDEHAQGKQPKLNSGSCWWVEEAACGALAVAGSMWQVVLWCLQDDERSCCGTRGGLAGGALRPMTAARLGDGYDQLLSAFS
jgi:hypothetical protein